MCKDCQRGYRTSIVGSDGAPKPRPPMMFNGVDPLTFKDLLETTKKLESTTFISTPRSYGRNLFKEHWDKFSKDLSDGYKDMWFYDEAGFTRTGWDVEKLNKLVKGKKKMSIVSKVKDLVLSSDEKLFKKYGIKDSEGDLTETGEDLLMEVLFEKFKADVVEKLKAVEAAEKADNK